MHLRATAALLVPLTGLLGCTPHVSHPPPTPTFSTRTAIDSDELALTGAPTEYRVDLWQAWGDNVIVRVNCSDLILVGLDIPHGPAATNHGRRNGGASRRERAITDVDCVRLQHEFAESGIWEMSEGFDERTGAMADGATFTVDACEPGHACRHVVRAVGEFSGYDTASNDVLTLAFGARR